MLMPSLPKLVQRVFPMSATSAGPVKKELLMLQLIAPETLMSQDPQIRHIHFQ